jgi:hypothetical protein
MMTRTESKYFRIVIFSSGSASITAATGEPDPMD